MSIRSRILFAVAAILVLGALVAPIWRVKLFAPQYPEGLGMTIHAGTVRGAKENDLQSINMLNHYIGMKAIIPDAIPELKIIPWVLGTLSIAGMLVVISARRRLAMAWVVLYGAFGAFGMWDFYRWEYSYGHDLDFERAIIKIPGMTYQPPLIGTKQLLNFTASSWPDIGGYCMFAAFLFAAAAILLDMRTDKLRKA